MKQYKVKLFISVLALLGFNNAWAVPCGDTGSGVFLDASFSTTAYILCEDGSGNNSPYPNSLDVFGMTYDALSKQETPGSFGQLVDIDLMVTPTSGTISGEWSFTNVAAYDEYVVVLKDGGVNDAFGNSIKWSSYLLDSTLFGGNGSTWSGYWVYGGEKALSNFVVYGKPASTVPEPAILGLIGFGMFGLAFARRSRQYN